MEIIVAMGPHVLRIRRGLIHAGEKCGTARRARGIGGEDIRVAHAFCREPVQVRRANVLRTVASKIMGDVLADEPEDVRSLGGFRAQDGSGEREGKKDLLDR